QASAARCTLTVSASPLLWLLLPICSTNFPSGVNFKYASSATGLSPARPDVGQLFPPIHTKPSWSIWMPCSRSGQSYPLPAPPQVLMMLPAASNTTIAGAAFPESSGLSVRGRCRSQTLSCASMAKLDASPSLNCGGSFGHAGSTSNTGTLRRACACGDCAAALVVKSHAAGTPAAMRYATRPMRPRVLRFTASSCHILFDHLVGAGENGRWNVHAERPGCLEIDDQLVLGRRLYRQGCAVP